MIRTCAVAALVAACGYARAPVARPPVLLFVAVDGNDAWSGTLDAPNATRTDGPFASLERARDAVRARKARVGLPPGGVVIELRGGRYQRGSAFELGPEDSGEPGAPVTYRARAGEVVELDGGVAIDAWSAVTDPNVLARLDPAARAHVVAAPLGGIDPGPVPGGGVEVVFDHRLMTLARWPNAGFATIVDVATAEPVDVRGTRGDRSGKIVYDGDRPARWRDEPAPWVHGYWFWDWADDREPVSAIDLEHHTLALGPPFHHYGYRAGQWYYAFNLLSELDTPGEWYIDRETKVLYFWPPRPSGMTEVSIAQQLLRVDGAHDVVVRGLVFESARGDAIAILESERVVLAGLTVRDTGGWAVKISGGREDVIEHSEIAEIGEGGVLLAGGDRRTLRAAHHRAVANHIHDYSLWRRTGQAGVEVTGVGQEVIGNQIHDAPHVAVAFSGNDHRIERNVIERVCEETNDAGAIAAGRDWTMRGTAIRNNIIRDVRGFRGNGCNGVMLDDLFSGTEIIGNIFDGVTRAILVGGGRDNVIERNLFARCETGVRLDARGLGWAGYSIDESMRPSLEAMPYQTPPWSTRYPRLATILSDTPAAPKRNRIAHNIASSGALDDIDPSVRALQELVGNVGEAVR